MADSENVSVKNYKRQIKKLRKKLKLRKIEKRRCRKEKEKVVKKVEKMSKELQKTNEEIEILKNKCDDLIEKFTNQLKDFEEKEKAIADFAQKVKEVKSVRTEAENEEVEDVPWSLIEDCINSESSNIIPITFIACEDGEHSKPIQEVENEVLPSGSGPINLEVPIYNLADGSDLFPAKIIQESVGAEANYELNHSMDTNSDVPSENVDTLTQDATKIDTTNFDYLVENSELVEFTDQNSSLRLVKDGGDKLEAGDKSDGGVKTYKRHKRCVSRVTKYSCSICEMSFHTNVSLAEHEETHNPSKQVGGDQPSTSSSVPFVRSQHRKQHAEFYECSDCLFTTPVLRQYEAHLSTHSSQETLACDSCLYKTTHLSFMEKHKERHKLGDFLCEQCGFAARQKSHLDQHMIIHIQDKPYKCESCDYAAALPQYLEVHKKRNSH